jgi:hypothetical protein
LDTVGCFQSITFVDSRYFFTSSSVRASTQVIACQHESVARRYYCIEVMSVKRSSWKLARIAQGEKTNSIKLSQELSHLYAGHRMTGLQDMLPVFQNLISQSLVEGFGSH